MEYARLLKNEKNLDLNFFITLSQTSCYIYKLCHAQRWPTVVSFKKNAQLNFFCYIVVIK